MRPGPRLVRSLGWLCAGALAVPVLPEAALFVLVLLAAALLAAAAEARALARVRVALDAPEALVLNLGATETVTLGLRTDAPWAVHLTVRQAWPDLVEASDKTQAGLCRPGEILKVGFPVRALARGRERLTPAWAALRIWGFAERVLPVGGPRELQVLPDLRAVGRLHAKLNRYALRGLGARASARLGKGREFDRLRDYVRGDEFRDIAWKASARHGRLIVREYRLDRSQDVLVCLDRGHRMGARVGGLAKLDHAVNASLVLAYICNRMEDRVGILSFATEVEAGPAPGRGGVHLRRVTAFASAVHGSYVHTDYLSVAADLRRRVRHRTLIVILTALPELEHDPLRQAVGMLAPQHLPLVVVLTDPDLRAAGELLPADRAELARTLAAQDVLAGREQTVRELRRLGAMVVETAPGDAGVEAMNAYVEVKRRQLL